MQNIKTQDQLISLIYPTGTLQVTAQGDSFVVSNVTQEQLSSTIQTLVEQGVLERQHPTKWFPTNETEANEDFGCPESVGDYYALAIVDNQEMDLAIGPTEFTAQVR